MRFELVSRDGPARRGRLRFARGTVETPAFMPVGTYASVKAVTAEELRELGTEIVLANTFHLMLRPGVDVIRAHRGGLHGFMHWDGPILTDSGGFQVWSLASLRRLSEAGVEFRSPVDGEQVMLTPERSIQVQHALEADIVMIFDECTAYPVDESRARESMELSLSCKAGCTRSCVAARWPGSPRSDSTATRSGAWRSGSPKRNALRCSRCSSHCCRPSDPAI
jgi:queuine tRNA-ribosyltransferase